MTALSVLFVGFVVLVVSVYLKLFPSIEEKLRWGVLSLFLLIVYDLVISIGWAVMSLVSASKNDVSKSLSEPVGEKREQQVGDAEDTVDNASKPVGISASPSRGGRGDAASGSSSSSSPSRLDRIALKTALVVDVGEVNGRFGFAGDEVPLVRDCQALLAGLVGNGKKPPTATQVAASGGLRQHIKDGAISDWDSLEKVWFSQYGGGSNAGGSSSSSHTSLRTGASDAIDPSEHPVLLSWSPSFSSKDAEQAAEIFFETRRVPALSLGISPVLALYASGRTTGCSVHSGESFTHAMAVSEGFALAGTHMRTHHAGKLVTDKFAAMLQMLQRQQQSLLPPAQQLQDKFNPALSDYSAFLRLEKSRYCVCSSAKFAYAAQSQVQAQAQAQAIDEPIFSALGQSDAAAPFHASSTAATATATAAPDTHTTQLKLPDGNIVNLPGADPRLPREPAHMQFTCAEGLFRSDNSIQKIIERSIAAAGGALTGTAGKADLYGTAAGASSGDGGVGSLLGVRQDELWSNIVISGGNANLPGFSQRLQHELGELLSLGGVDGLDGGEALKYAAGVPVYETEAADRGDALWLGGSVLASFESFSGNWVKRAEYLENGAGSFIHTRCQTKL